MPASATAPSRLDARTAIGLVRAGGLRRVPHSDRALQSVDRILDGAADAIARVGCERLTTADVALSAGVAVGSVYRYFPDRVSVLLALGMRNQRRLTDRLADAMTPSHDSVEGLADALFAAMVAHYRDEPAMRTVGTGDGIDLGADSQHTAWPMVAAPVIRALHQQTGVCEPVAFAGITTVCSVVDALLAIAFRDHAAGEPALLLHAREACRWAVEHTLQAESAA